MPTTSGPPGKEAAVGIPGGTGVGSGAGIGNDASGARAIYAPTPTIPDELRENVFQAVAVAHFKVSPDGAVEVTLEQPTPNPRLNQILLNTLRQWKFFPAMKDGIAINSEFDVTDSDQRAVRTYRSVCNFAAPYVTRLMSGREASYGG